MLTHPVGVTCIRGETMAMPRNAKEIVTATAQPCQEPRSWTHERDSGGRIKLTYDLLDKLKLALRRTCYLETACQLVGISNKTLIGWVHEGQDMIARLESGQITASRCTPRQAILVDMVIELQKVFAEIEAEDQERLAALASMGEFQAIKFRLERGPGRARWGQQNEMTLRIDQDPARAQDGAEAIQGPTVVDYAAVIGDAPELSILEGGDIEDVEIIDEQSA